MTLFLRQPRQGYKANSPRSLGCALSQVKVPSTFTFPARAWPSICSLRPV